MLKWLRWEKWALVSPENKEVLNYYIWYLDGCTCNFGVEDWKCSRRDIGLIFFNAENPTLLFHKDMQYCSDTVLSCCNCVCCMHRVKSYRKFQALLYAYWLSKNPYLSLQIKWPIVHVGLSDARGGEKKKSWGLLWHLAMGVLLYLEIPLPH